MPEKTAAEMQMRYEQLRGLRPQLTLRQCAELDAIQNHGIVGWRGWLHNQEQGRLAASRRAS